MADTPTSPPVPGMPNPLSVYVQLGFAGLVAVMFPFLIWHSEQRASEDRQMYREEMREQRSELRRAVDAMNTAVGRLDNGQRQIKRDVDVLKMDPAAFTAPPPRSSP